MRVLIIGSSREAAAVESQMLMDGHAVGYTGEELTAATLLRRSAYDLVLLFDCFRLEDADLVAEDLKLAAMAGTSAAPPYLFVLWDTISGFEEGRLYGLKGIDMLLEDFSAKRCEDAYQYARHNRV